MDALDLLRDQAANADRILRQVFDPVTPQQAEWRLPGSVANTIGATFMHVYYSEDQMVHTALGRATVFETGGWKTRFGFDHAGVWSYTGGYDPRLLQEYADEVSAARRAYLESLTPQALEEMVDTPRGRQPRASRLSVYFVSHKLQHAGEIAALLGCQGARGLPF